MATFHLLILQMLLLFSPSTAATFTLANNCGYTVWPGILSGAGTGTAPLSTTGFTLNPGESQSVGVPTGWSGRLWGRTLCSADPTTGRFACATGDCGSSTLQCSGSGAAPPATLAEFTLDGHGGLDFYDVSLVDGYNLPMLVVPRSGSGSCSPTGCLADLNALCPLDLKVTRFLGSGSGPGSGPVACKSACEAYGTEEYCCSGAHGNPNTCRPTAYSQLFKKACPRAYSYAYDDATSTFTCGDANYDIIFCPSATSGKSWEDNGNGNANPQAAVPLMNRPMVFFGPSRSGPRSPLASPVVIWAVIGLIFMLL